MPPSSLTPVKKGGYTAVLYLMNDLQFRMRGREPISLIIRQARPLAMCSPILHYQKGNVRNQAWRKYPIPCLVHQQGPTAINVHDLDRRAAPVNLWKSLISIVIDNLPLSLQRDVGECPGRISRRDDENPHDWAAVRDRRCVGSSRSCARRSHRKHEAACQETPDFLSKPRMICRVDFPSHGPSSMASPCPR